MADLVPQPISIQSLYSMYAEDKLFVNRRYQRKLVWTLEEKQKLIESILKKYPIPAILVADRAGTVSAYEIIDGLQRLQAIVSFIEGSYKTLDGKLFNLDYFPTAKGRKESGVFAPIDGEEAISQKDVSTLLDYSLALSVMRNASDAEVDDVFDRINTYGHRLSDQERRQAGVQNEFSTLIRKLASTIRGDASPDILNLASMPSISVDLPTTKHGYQVKADEVFWVDEGILRATDLRDSMDEQCLADIVASLIQNEMVDRSKDFLDKVYDRGAPEAEKVLAALEVYGSDRVSDEVKFTIDQIRLVCDEGNSTKLRDIVFTKRNTNGFPTVFAVILIALHDLFVKKKMRISDYTGVKSALTKIDKSLNTSRSATGPKERKKNVDIVRALVEPFFVDGDSSKEIYSNHSSSDIEVSIRRSEIELCDYELKQGIVTLGANREVDHKALDKILSTITAIANNGKGRNGKVMLGITDNEADATRVKALDGIDAKRVGKRFVVGINREAHVLGKSVEDFHGMIRDAIKHSEISEPLKASVLSSIDYNSFYGFGVIIVSVPAQSDLSFYKDEVYWREGDSTTKATSQKKVAELAKRF